MTTQRPAFAPQRAQQAPPQRSGTDLIVEELHLLRLDIGDLIQIMRAQAEANEPVLYCAPDGNCPGGFRLYKHKQEFWKNDGKDNDRLFHALPEELWYVFQGEGAFKGQTVKNHNVWRSRAITVGGEAEPVQGADPGFDPDNQPF
jgi:hypothetical protein